MYKHTLAPEEPLASHLTALVQTSGSLKQPWHATLHLTTKNYNSFAFSSFAGQNYLDVIPPPPYFSDFHIYQKR
jgi:hypothetical protein